MIVTFAVVAYNGASTLPHLLEELLGQDYPREKIEVLLIDSMSTDKTREIMENFAAQEKGFFRVAVLENPGKILPCGCNVMLRNYTGEAVVRIDAHASIPKDFIKKNVAVLERGEFVSGGRRPNIIEASTAWKDTLLIAESAMFGSGIAPYRSQEKPTYVSSVFHGMYRREVYETVGFYDERLARTEDNDMSYRIRKAGYRLHYDPNIVSYQHTRNTLKKMLKQKYLNGYWIGRTMYVNPHCFSIFHLVPAAFVCGIVITSILAALGCPILAALMWALYWAVAITACVCEMVRRPFSGTNLLLPVLFFLLHISYGVGTVWGLLRGPIREVEKK